MQTRRVRILIQGKVQGVFYRQSALAKATALGLTGWVRNLGSGEVEALAEGPPETVDAFLQWCEEGPPSASVEKVDVEDAPDDGPLAAFHVERTA
jgi:acylphosphatase